MVGNGTRLSVRSVRPDKGFLFLVLLSLNETTHGVGHTTFWLIYKIATKFGSQFPKNTKNLFLVFCFDIVKIGFSFWKAKN